MEKSGKHTIGSVRVSEDVIIKIAQTAALEIDGVSLAKASGSPISRFSKNSSPVRARTSGEAASVKVEILVDEGVNAVQAAENVQKSVKSAVQNMTGFTVTKVDVNIVGVAFKEDAQTENGEA